VGASYSTHQRLVTRVALFAVRVQFRAVVTKRVTASPLHDIVGFNVITFGTFVVVVVPLRIIRSLGMPRAFVAHPRSLSLSDFHLGLGQDILHVRSSIILHRSSMRRQASPLKQGRTKGDL